MKVILLLVIILHGLVHLIGFAKAFRLAPLRQIKAVITEPGGILWLAASALFLFASLLWFQENNLWTLFLIIGVLDSQYLIFTHWKDTKWGTLLNTLILLTAITGYGMWRFANLYRNEVQKELTRSAAPADTILSDGDLRHLPDLVQKYIRNAGALGKPKVRNFKVEFSGQIRKNEGSEWMAFHSQQYNFLIPATRLFFMNATIKNFPVAGYHCFKNGSAFMDIRLLSLFNVQYQSSEAMRISETVTFFNDMCCMAPATLIDPRIKWLGTGDHSVKAQFTNQGISVAAWLYFNNQGQLINFVSGDRYAAGENNTMKQLPWSTPLKNYKTIDGHQLPSYAEAIYTYPTGAMVYGHFSLQHIEYNCTEIQ